MNRDNDGTWPIFVWLKDKYTTIVNYLPDEVKFFSSMLICVISVLILFKIFVIGDKEAELEDECESYAEMYQMEWNLVGEDYSGDCFVKYNDDWINRSDHERIIEDLFRQKYYEKG